MAEKFNPTEARKYFTKEFYEKHIIVTGGNCKKRAEEVFQSRIGELTKSQDQAHDEKQKIKLKEKKQKLVNTLLCLSHQELVQLAGEIHGKQEEFSRSPAKTYRTEHAYERWSRGGKQSKDKQRAIKTIAPFSYNVAFRGGIYVVVHFDG